MLICHTLFTHLTKDTVIRLASPLPQIAAQRTFDYTKGRANVALLTSKMITGPARLPVTWSYVTVNRHQSVKSSHQTQLGVGCTEVPR